MVGGGLGATHLLFHYTQLAQNKPPDRRNTLTHLTTAVGENNMFFTSIFRITNRAQLRQRQERRSRQLPALPVMTHRYFYTMRILFELVSYPQKKARGQLRLCFSHRYFVLPEQSPASPTARASLTPTTRTPCDDSQVFLYNENFVRTCFVSPEESQRSASPVARASLMPATHTPGDDSQVSGDSETFVPAYFVSPEQNQSSILFRAPLRQQRLNDSERKEIKRSGCAFAYAFSCDC